MRYVKETASIIDKIDLACEILGNPLYIWEKGKIEDQQLLL